MMVVMTISKMEQKKFVLSTTLESVSLNFKTTNPSSPSMVRLLLLVSELLSRWTLILSLFPPASLNCLSSSLMKSMSSGGKPVNSSTMDFGDLVGFAEEAFLVGRFSGFFSRSAADVCRANTATSTDNWSENKSGITLLDLFKNHHPAVIAFKELITRCHLVESINSDDVWMLQFLVETNGNKRNYTISEIDTFVLGPSACALQKIRW